MTHIIVKEFKPHYNVALGKVVTSQRQYNEEMKRGNYIPYEQAQEIVRNNQEKRKHFSVSDDAKDWMRGVKDRADKKGNVRLSEREITALQDKGQTMSSRYLPEHYQTIGGFSE